MSQNRDTDRGPDEKPGKKTKYSDASSSIPTKTGTDAQSFDMINMHGDESKSGSKKRMFLFKMILTASDVEGGTLFFPSEVASGHFPSPAEQISQEKLEVYDTKGNIWIMTLKYSPVECAFVITTKWNEFINLHHLQAMDAVQFYKPINPQHDKHYLIKYIRNVEVDESDYETDEEDIDLEDGIGNLMFELQLTPNDIRSRISIPEKQIVKHFPEIKKPGDEPGPRDYYFTDVKNTDWCMKTMFNQVLDGYVIVDGWTGFVNEHKLKAMDMIKLYRPAKPSHEIHFLVAIVREEEAGNKMTRTSTAKNLWGDSAKEFDEEQGGSTESGSDNDMDIDGGDEKTALRQSSIDDPEDDSSCGSGS
ncbi:unnamed protein product [Camellia sinensis]